MPPLEAHVKNGRLVLDEPTALPEGTSVCLVAVDDDIETKQRARMLGAMSDGEPANRRLGTAGARAGSKVKTTWAEVQADGLKGECEGASHFVRGAMVGMSSWVRPRRARRLRNTARQVGASSMRVEATQSIEA